MVSIIILNHNGKRHVVDCLSSVLRSTYPKYQVVVIDNASTDESVELVQQLFGSNSMLKIARNSKNLGLAGGYNSGLKFATGKYVAFLNVDVVVDKDWLNEPIRIMEGNSDIGAVACKLLYAHNPKRFQMMGFMMDLYGLGFKLGYLEEDFGQFDKISEVFSVDCAAFVARKKALEEVGGFDEDFFWYYEDCDLCWRMWIRRWRIMASPSSKVYHKEASTILSSKLYRTLYFSRRNRIAMILKNYSLRSIIRHFPVGFMLMALLSLFKFGGRLPIAPNPYAITFIRALLWNLYNFKKTLQKRRAVQNSRLVDDKTLMAKGVMTKFRLKGLDW